MDALLDSVEALLDSVEALLDSVKALFDSVEALLDSANHSLDDETKCNCYMCYSAQLEKPCLYCKYIPEVRNVWQLNTIKQCMVEYMLGWFHLSFYLPK